MDDIKILGFSGTIESVKDVLDNISRDDGSIVQLLNADNIAGRKHIIHAINQSFLAFKRGENFAKDLGVEICLRSSAQKQISKAFKLLGLKEGQMNLCAILINADDSILDYLNDNFTRNDDVLKPIHENLVKAFDISNNLYGDEDIIIDKISKLSIDS